MTKKHLICTALLLILAAFVLTACDPINNGNSGDNPTIPTDPTTIPESDWKAITSSTSLAGTWKYTEKHDSYFVDSNLNRINYDPLNAVYHVYPKTNYILTVTNASSPAMEEVIYVAIMVKTDNSDFSEDEITNILSHQNSAPTSCQNTNPKVLVMNFLKYSDSGIPDWTGCTIDSSGTYLKFTPPSDSTNVQIYVKQ